MKNSSSKLQQTILVIDDDALSLGVITNYLMDPNWELVIARDGISGVERAERVQPDLILLDVLMPKLDGFETCRKLKQNPKTKQIPIIFMTALSDVKEKVRGFELGAVDYITKPIDRSELFVRVQTQLRLRAMTDHLEQLVLERTEQLENINQHLEEEISERIQIQDALKQSEERYRFLINNAQEGVFMVKNQKIVYANPKTTEIFKKDQQDLIGTSFISYVHPDDLDRINKIHKERLTGEKTPNQYEVRILDTEGNIRWLDVTVVMSMFASDQSILVFVNDITEQKLARLKIEEQLKNLAALHVIDSAITTNTDLAETMPVILEQVKSRLLVDAVDILIYDEDTKMFFYAGSSGFNKKPATDFIRVGYSLAGKIAVDRKMLYIKELLNLEDPPNIVVSEWQKEEFASYVGFPLISKGKLMGVLEIFNRTRLDPEPGWFDFADTLSQQTAIAIDNLTLLDELQRSNIKLELAYETTLEGWARALELRDFETKGHSIRVVEQSLKFSKAIGISGDDLIYIRRGALMHDIGKLGIPDHILLKPGKLTDEEWKVMRQHTIYGAEMLRPIEFLRPSMDIVMYHHEKWDGSGYPNGLKGEQIPLTARLFSLVDVWDSLLSDRPYRKGWPREKVISYIKELSAVQFDPHLVEIFFDVI